MICTITERKQTQNYGNSSKGVMKRGSKRQEMRQEGRGKEEEKDTKSLVPKSYKVWDLWCSPGKHFSMSSSPYCYPRTELGPWTVPDFCCVFFYPLSLFIHFYILRVNFIFMLKFMNLFISSILGPYISKN